MWIRLKKFRFVIGFLKTLMFVQASLSFAGSGLPIEAAVKDQTMHRQAATQTCPEVSKEEVVNNVKMFMGTLFAKKEPSIGDAIRIFGTEAASEGFLEREYELGIDECLRKSKSKSWDALTESQKTQCGDPIDNNNKSLFFRKIRKQTGIIEGYLIKKISMQKNENGQLYFLIQISFKKRNAQKKYYLELSHRGDDCQDEGGWMNILSINGKKVW